MRLFVGNLSMQVTDAQLSDLGVPYGTVLSARVMIEPSNGGSRGFGFLELSTADESSAALTALDGREVHGQRLKVRPERTPNA
jgi:heterogeneous nuclear ribonucleoprotein A1/A3